MFEKREVRSFPGARREDLWPKVWDWWSRQGFHLTQTGPYRFHGASYYSRIGLRREFDLIVDDVQGGTGIDLMFTARITDEGVVGGAVAALVFLPVAVVGGAISYSEYETDASNLMAAFWQYVHGVTGSAPIGPLPQLPLPCSGCGAAMLPDWKVCPYCGRPRTP